MNNAPRNYSVEPVVARLSATPAVVEQVVTGPLTRPGESRPLPTFDDDSITVEGYMGAIYLPMVVGFDLARFTEMTAAGERGAFQAAFIDPDSSRWRNKIGTREDQARIILNTILPGLGPIVMSRLEPADVWCMVEGRVDGYAPIREGSRAAARVSPKTALNELNVVSSSCRDAMARSYLAMNPAEAARYLLHGQWNVMSSASRVVLTVSQRDAFYAATPANHLAVMRLMGTYGLRLGEALAVPDANFDPDESTLHVDQSWSRARLIGPKTDAGDRILILGDDDVELLLQARARARQMQNDRRILFPGPQGGYIDPSNWRETVFHPTAQLAAERNGIPQRLADLLVPHALRHTAISLLLEVDGVEMHQARSIAGHSSVTTTVDLYGHVKPRRVPGQQ